MSTFKSLALLIFAAAVAVVAPVIAKKTVSSEDKVLTGLQESARQINQEGPRLIGNGNRLDGAIAGPGRTITYQHTNLEFFASNIDKTAFETAYAAAVRSQACSLKKLLSQDVTMIYSYKDRNGALIGNVAVNKTHCQ